MYVCMYLSIYLSVYLSIYQEATDISSLRPQLDKLHIPLYGILHEEKGAEQFKQYLKGDLLFDEKVASRVYSDS